MRKRCLICLHVLMVLFIVSERAAPEEDSLKLIAKGGHFADPHLVWDSLCDDENDYDFYVYLHLKLTVQIKNLHEAVRIEGVIAHPYGEGPFEAITPGDSPLIVSSEIVTEGTYVAFAMELAAPDSPQSLTLFTAKPDMCVDRNGELIWGGSEYPASVEWVYFRVEDLEGTSVPAYTHTDPVLITTDFESGFEVFPQGFSARIDELHLVDLNGRELYPPWELTPNQFGHADGFSLGGSPATVLFGIPGLPMVFEVALEDGQRHRIPVEETTSQVILTPTSAAAHWEHY